LAYTIIDHIQPCAFGNPQNLFIKLALGVNDDFSAPASRATLAFSDVDTVAITKVPALLAIWVSKNPTPPAAA